MFKVLRSNIQTAITLPRIVRFRSHFVRRSTVVKPVYNICSRSKVKGQGYGVKVQGYSVTQRISSKEALRRQRIGWASSNLAWETKMKGIGTAWRRAASICNAFAIATFSSFLFLPEHGVQQPRRGRPSNVYQRFGHRCRYYHWPIYLLYPSPNFYRGQKVRFLALSSTTLNFEAL